MTGPTIDLRRRGLPKHIYGAECGDCGLTIRRPEMTPTAALHALRQAHMEDQTCDEATFELVKIRMRTPIGETRVRPLKGDR